jgi:hypothetical protein
MSWGPGYAVISSPRRPSPDQRTFLIELLSEDGCMDTPTENIRDTVP